MPRTIAAIAAAAALIASPALAQPADELRALSTSFDTTAALKPWREHAVEGWAPKWAPPRAEGGHLVLQPTSSGWFEENQAGHLYRTVSGDFIVTTRLRVEGTRAPTPQTEFSLAGLFIRAPRDLPNATSWSPGRENWLFFSVGTASPAGQPQYEIKTTTNSLSTLMITPAQTGWVELRIARHGELFTLLHKPDGAREWRVLNQFIRPDLPQTLNVGLTAYADYGSVAPTYPNYNVYNTQGAPTQNADLIARVHWITFRRPTTGRFPIANIDTPATFGRAVIDARRADVMAD